MQLRLRRVRVLVVDRQCKATGWLICRSELGVLFLFVGSGLFCEMYCGHIRLHVLV